MFLIKNILQYTTFNNCMSTSDFINFIESLNNSSILIDENGLFDKDDESTGAKIPSISEQFPQFFPQQPLFFVQVSNQYVSEIVFRSYKIRGAKRKNTFVDQFPRKLVRTSNNYIKCIQVFNFNGKLYVTLNDIRYHLGCSTKDVQKDNETFGKLKNQLTDKMKDHKCDRTQVLNFMTNDLEKELPNHISHFSTNNLTGMIAIDEINDPIGHFFPFLIMQHQMKIDTKTIIPIKTFTAKVFDFSASVVKLVDIQPNVK